ncbi:MAG: Type 1 glutamine amidotransferase-like domain-containing protein [Nitrososphaerales archaeon]
MKRIFLSGGGGALDSIYLDKKFASLSDRNKPLIYVPIAMKTKPYKECYAWFRSVFLPLGIKKFEMLTNLIGIDNRKLDSSAGIYIGGGDTVKLLKEIRQSNFDKYLTNYIKKGKPVYGGSAGAIIFGLDVRTAPEAQNSNENEAKGLNAIFGYSVCTHYNPFKVDIMKIYKRYKCPIIAIPERSGAYIKGKVLEVVGFEPLYLTEEDGIVSLNSMMSR